MSKSSSSIPDVLSSDLHLQRIVKREKLGYLTFRLSEINGDKDYSDKDYSGKQQKNRGMVGIIWVKCCFVLYFLLFDKLSKSEGEELE